MFALTTAAAQQIMQAAQASDAASLALRIAARLDADGSTQYGMGFDEPRDEDLKLDLEGVAVIIGEDSQALLANTQLDYVEMEPNEFNFIFIEAGAADCAPAPHAASGCGSGGCGSGGCASGARRS